MCLCVCARVSLGDGNSENPNLPEVQKDSKRNEPVTQTVTPTV